jgi:hypothetical protein
LKPPGFALARAKTAVQVLAEPGNEKSVPGAWPVASFNFACVDLIRGFAADEKFKLFMEAISSVYRRLPSLLGRSIL